MDSTKVDTEDKNRHKISKGYFIFFLVNYLLVNQVVEGWVQEPQARKFFKYADLTNVPQFLGSTLSFNNNLNDKDTKQYFKLLQHETQDSILVGARNAVYNLSLPDLIENKNQRIEWPSSGAHRELCYLKGKSEIDCQNYIRIGALDTSNALLVCGTNSFKPLCRRYRNLNNNASKLHEQFEGIGVCPYDPTHNSTAIYADGALFSATAADFSGGDPLIYRSPQRTERYDLRQLNDPAFVGSVTYGEHVYVFFRETAVEHMNCGKVVYSRVGRICASDRGGPRHFGDRWTSFVKARLNCSVAGDYPFYFDEVQAVSGPHKGVRAGGVESSVVYLVATTAPSAIGGSAVCAFDMDHVAKLFDTASFKHQPHGINSNWLPVPPEQVPVPRPGSCLEDSRTLSDNNVNFIRAHSLLDPAIPGLTRHPLITRVSLSHRMFSIAVQPQIRALNDKTYDMLYIGTDDGRVLQALNTALAVSLNASNPILVSEWQLAPQGEPIRELRMAGAANNRFLVAVTDERVLAADTRFVCKSASNCRECLQLRNPECAYDRRNQMCISLQDHPYPNKERFLQSLDPEDYQSVANSDAELCKKSQTWPGVPASRRRPDANKGRDETGHSGDGSGENKRISSDELDNEIVIELVGSRALADDVGVLRNGGGLNDNGDEERI
ncbi:semaphorin-1A-like, partial [Ctenocephalides felis]|uniref:semaphorin-1A-like n=1 Tax=Ctenocephalides felis TaxID=7515 RepID=UPI000E6E17D5